MNCIDESALEGTPAAWTGEGPVVYVLPAEDFDRVVAGVLAPRGPNEALRRAWERFHGVATVPVAERGEGGYSGSGDGE